MSYKIPFIKPSFPKSDEIAGDYEKIVASNWFTNFGPFEKEFSQKAADYIGGDVFTASVSNATLGLLVAIKTLIVPEGSRRKVLVPSFTFAAGPEMLILAGLTPVFIDIDKDTWQPDLEQASVYIENNKDTVAGILLCNIFGVGNTSIVNWEKLAEFHQLPLVIDSAAGFGSMYEPGKRIGSRGDCEIFSLHATKPFAVGEGGLIVSRNAEIINHFKTYENFGFDKDKRIDVIGINAKMQEFNAAIGLRQLKNFDQRLADRRISLEKYKNRLKSIHCVFQDNDQNSTVPFVSVALSSAELSRDVIRVLNESGVEARKYYEPLHRQQVLNEYSENADNLKHTDGLYDRIVSLPLHDSMADGDIEFITDIIVKIYEEYKS